MENKKTFGGYVKAKRTEAGLTQKEFADKLYVTESAVSKWERGLSYPDITLISEICAILNVTERELLTASEDIQARNHEKLAKRYLNLIKSFKVTQYFLYGIALLTCFIVNLAVFRTLSWFFIVLTAEMVGASLTLLPILIEKRRGLVTLAGFTVSLVALLAVCAAFTGGGWFWVALVSVLFGFSVIFTPLILRAAPLPPPLYNHKALLNLAIHTPFLVLLLFVIEIYAKGDWFFSVALPLTAFWLILPWGYTLILRYAKINGFFKTSGCLALTTALFYFMRGFTDMILGETFKLGLYFNFSDWSMEYLNGNIDAIVFFSMLALTLVFAAAGVMRETAKKT